MDDISLKLCQRARAGDVEAASELLTQHYQQIYAFLRRLSGSEEDAADLTQKTFARVWTSLPAFEGRSSFTTWVHSIARHVYLDWRRRTGRTQARPDAWWQERPAEMPSPYDDTAEREQAAWLFTQVDELEQDVREAVHLHYFQGLTLNETSQVLGVSPGTVKNRLRDAIELIRAKTAEPRSLQQ